MLGNIYYLHMFRFAETIAVKQELDKNRFVKIIEETPVRGGNKDEAYMQYLAQSLFDESKVYKINNYLSPFNYISIPDLKDTIENMKELFDEERLSIMKSILDEIDSYNKETPED